MSLSQEKFINSYNQIIKVIRKIKNIVIDKDTVIIKTMIAILANGHILIDDIPGVGKTTLALAFSKTMNFDCKRLQFTPDVMPSDILGFTVYNKQSNTFEYRPGAALCNLFLADEINRTSSRTQSALLEVMEERKLTVDGTTYELPNPYIVIATQNPIGSLGTHPLPDSQLDRFMICLSMGYPNKQSEINILKGRNTENPLDKLETVVDKESIITAQKLIDDIHIDDVIYDYLMNLVHATRTNAAIRLGVSPRGALALMKMAKASAFLQKRDFVTPKDLEFIFLDTCIHRIVLTAKAKAETDAKTILTDIFNKVHKPSVARKNV